MNSIFSSIVPLVILGGLLYFLFKPRGGAGSGGKDTYYYVISFLVVLILYWAVADLARIFLDDWMGVIGSSSYSQQDMLRGLSMRLAAILVAFPIWAFHWFKASAKPRSQWDLGSRRSYGMAMMVITALGAIGTLTGLVYLGLNWMLGVGEDVSQAIPYLLPYSITGAALWVIHFVIWKGAGEEKKEVKEV